MTYKEAMLELARISKYLECVKEEELTGWERTVIIDLVKFLSAKTETIFEKYK